MRKTLFIKNALVLTVTGIILRVLGIVFKVWLAAAIGAAGLGLYHLCLSVFMLAGSFAISGIPVAVSVKVTESLAKGSAEGARTTLRRALSISILFSVVTFCLLFFGADFIAVRFLFDKNTALPLRVFGFSLPFTAISAVFKGYFVARRNVTPNSSAVLIEQAVRIVLCILLVRRFLSYGVVAATAAVVLGEGIGEAVSAVYIGLRFKFDNKRLTGSGEAAATTGQLLKIMLPLTAARYSTSALRAVENTMVPRSLTKSGMTAESSLSAFGAVKGMVLPVLFFPSSLLNAFTTLLLPELAEARAKGRPYTVKLTVKRALLSTWVIGVIFGAIFCFCGGEIGEVIYKSGDTGRLIMYLAPLVPFMYCDGMADGLLKGLGGESFTFRVALWDSLLRIVLIIPIVPRYGVAGFLFIMLLSNLFTFFLHTVKLIKLSGVEFNVAKELLLPPIAAISVCLAFNALFSFLYGVGFIVLFSLCSLGSFILLMLAFKIHYEIL